MGLPLFQIRPQLLLPIVKGGDYFLCENNPRCKYGIKYSLTHSLTHSLTPFSQAASGPGGRVSLPGPLHRARVAGVDGRGPRETSRQEPHPGTHPCRKGKDFGPFYSIIL